MVSDDHYRSMFEREMLWRMRWQIEATQYVVQVRHLNAACLRHKRTIRRLRDEVERLRAALNAQA